MLDRIFNRKYIKALKMIDDELEYLKQREEWYKQQLHKYEIGSYEHKKLIAWVDLYRHHREALVTLRWDLKNIC